MKNKFAYILSIVLGFAVNTAQALPDDQDKPIYISADSASINDKTGITTYKGNVEIKQGSLLIEADTVDMHRGDDGIDKLVAKGKPAHFRQQPKVNEPFSDAWGLNMVYEVEKKVLTITEKAKVVQDKDTFSGERIVYNLDRSIVDAFGDNKGDKGDGDGRVNMVIQPKKKAKAE